MIKIEKGVRNILDFLMDVFIYGLAGIVVYKIICNIDNKFFYSRKLNSSDEIKEKLKKQKDRKIAVIVSGSGAIISKIMGFHGNLVAAYGALKKRGYDDSEIIILSTIIPKGRIPEKSINSKPDIYNLNLILERITKNSAKNSILFYYTGHGKIINGKATLSLTNAEFFEKDFYNYFKNFEGKKIFTFDQCYSGSFLKLLKNLNNVVILASTKQDTTASNIPSVERKFWEKVSKGEDYIKAYKEAEKEIGLGHRLAKSFIEKISFNRIKNYYLTFER